MKTRDSASVESCLRLLTYPDTIIGPRNRRERKSNDASAITTSLNASLPQRPLSEFVVLHRNETIIIILATTWFVLTIDCLSIPQHIMDLLEVAYDLSRAGVTE